MSPRDRRTAPIEEEPLPLRLRSDISRQRPTPADLACLSIHRLLNRYADAATRGAWHEVASLLTPDCRLAFDTRSGRVFEVDGAAALGEFGATMTGAFSFYQHICQNIGPYGTAAGRSYSLEVASDAKTGDWIEFYGVYNDEYVLLEDRWLFSRREYRTHARRRAGHLESSPI